MEADPLHLSKTFALALVGTLLATAFAGCVTLPDAVEAASLEAPPMPDRPRVVIAVIDTGINAYHSEYARDAASTPLASPAAASPFAGILPEGVAPLPVDLTRLDDWEAAVEADWDRLMEIERGTLYGFPGTKIVGAISFDEPSKEWPLLLDRPGYYTHGTMTTSRAVGNTVSLVADDPDVHLVVIQGFNVEAVQWATEQDWIDIVSISAGISPISIVPGVPNALDSGQTEAYQALAHTRPFFASSGNGVLNAGLLGFPSWTRGSSGAPDVISVGANDNGRLSQWHNFDSYIAADGCANPAAAPGDTTKVGNTGGGTSSATPFSAGGGAKLLLEARRLLGDHHVGPRVDTGLGQPDGWTSGSPTDHQVILAKGEPGLVADGPLADGVFTLLEFKDVLYHTALVTPTEDESDGSACATNAPLDPALVPADARFPLQGYGEVNAESIDAALAVLRGEAELPARPMDDRQYLRAHQTKTAMMRAV